MVTELPSLSDSASHLANALGLLNQGKYEAALHHFALAQDGSNSPAQLVNQAVCLIHLDRPKEAQQFCDRALALNSQHAQAWMFRGVALHRQGHYREAYVCYDRALGEQRPHSTPWLVRGVNKVVVLKSLLKQIKNNKLLRLWVN